MPGMLPAGCRAGGRGTWLVDLGCPRRQEHPSRGNPTSPAASYSNSVCDTVGWSRTGVPYRNPQISTYTSAACTASRHTCDNWLSRAAKYAMSVTASPDRFTEVYHFSLGANRRRRRPEPPGSTPILPNLLDR